ncbi:unnamed protein product [Malus baccata var. baccata]
MSDNGQFLKEVYTSLHLFTTRLIRVLLNAFSFRSPYYKGHHIPLLPTTLVSQTTMAAFNRGKYTTILSIDGGGVRGIIPATILDCLESELQTTSTSLPEPAREALSQPCSPNQMKKNKPLFAANKIVEFFVEEAPKFFPPPNPMEEPRMGETDGIFLKNFRKLKRLAGNYLQEGFLRLTGPKFDGVYLRNKIVQTVGETKIRDTLTNIIIPSCDMKYLHPVVFSTLKAKRDHSTDVLLRDVCIATSAAPFYLPPHKFEQGTIKYDLVDGGVAANNPTLLAIIESAKEKSDNKSGAERLHIDSSKLLVLSLGTGSAKKGATLEVGNRDEWGILKWLVNPKSSSIPLIDVLTTPSVNMVEVYLSAFFNVSGSDDNYLRIQEDGLKPDEIDMTDSSPENLKKLVKAGTDLLEKTVSAMNLDTGWYDKPTDMTCKYKDAIAGFAQKLSREKKRRADT